jgi:hypothetical protein
MLARASSLLIDARSQSSRRQPVLPLSSLARALVYLNLTLLDTLPRSLWESREMGLSQCECILSCWEQREANEKWKGLSLLAGSQEVHLCSLLL